jgi:uncharacterized protein (AIM24 family)
MDTSEPLPNDEGTPEEEFLYLLSEGSDLLHAGQLPEAAEQFERALDIRPNHEQARNMLGLALFRIGRLERAAELFEGLVYDNPVEPSLRLNLAMVHLKGSRLAEAKDELDKVLSLNPDHTRAAGYMAMVCERLENFEEAADWYVRAGNDKQADAMRERLADAEPPPPPDASALDEDVPAPPMDALPVVEGEATMPDVEVDSLDPLPTEAPAETEVQAATMNALRAESLGRPSEPPSADEAQHAREASGEFGVELDGVPEPPPLADAEERIEQTMPYATLPAGFVRDPEGEADSDDEPPPPPPSDDEISFADVVVAEPGDTVMPEDAPEMTKPFAVIPPGLRDEPEAPVEMAADELELKPVEMAAEELELVPVEPELENELVNESPVEATLPYATLPSPPPGRKPLDAPDDPEEATAAPAPDDDEEMLPPPAIAVSPPPEPEPELEAAVAPPPEPDDEGEDAEGGGPPPLPVRVNTGDFEVISLPNEDTLELGSQPPPPPVDEPLRTALAPVTLEDLARDDLARVPDAPTIADGGMVVFPVRDVAYVRTDLLVSLVGRFEVEPVNRRYRGRRTDSIFGGTKTPLAAALGEGLAWLDPGELELTVISLDSDELYLIERSLLGFTGGLVWENGRLPDSDGEDLDIVHLRGSGALCTLTEKPLLAVDVAEDRPVTLAAERLVGWAGQVVPSRGPFPGLPDSVERPSVVRFDGTGRVLAW